MSASVAALPGAKARDRSIAGRRAARWEKFERERLIVDFLNRGVSVAEIAGRIGVTEKRMRALVREILARRAPAAPEAFAAIQASRLNEALAVAYSAMSPGNLKAVALVVRIVRELDRYHGFAPAGRRVPLPRGVEKNLPPGEGPGVAGDPRTVIRGRRMGCGEQDANSGGGAHGSCDPASIEAAGHTPSVAAPTEIRPEKAPQALGKIESAPGNGALPAAPDSALRPFRPAQGGPGAEPGEPPSAVAQESDPAADETAARGAEMAPQAVEILDSGPEDSLSAAVAEAPDAPCRNDASASRASVQTPPTAGADPSDPWIESLAPTTVLPTPDPAVPGGVRRLKIRMTRNGWAACAC